jgi:2-polyprenyl-3-methyl-5-hydroxy-6-metoxy-1,4-benzoquinol methylase
MKTEANSRSDYRARIYTNYASYFQDEAKTFDTQQAVLWGNDYDHYFRGWLPKSKDAAVVDVGCGSGKLLHYLRQRGYSRITGVDISPEQTALARQVSVDVVECDVVAFLEDHGGTYDLIVGLDIVEHFTKCEVLGFLDACYAALRPGGRIILQTPNAESVFGMKIRYGDFTHEVAFDSNSLKRLLCLSGFSNVEWREAGPVVHGAMSLVRYLIWKVIWTALAVYSLSETGSIGGGVYTRVFFVTARKDRGQKE